MYLVDVSNRVNMSNPCKKRTFASDTSALSRSESSLTAESGCISTHLPKPARYESKIVKSLRLWPLTVHTFLRLCLSEYYTVWTCSAYTHLVSPNHMSELFFFERLSAYTRENNTFFWGPVGFSTWALHVQKWHRTMAFPKLASLGSSILCLPKPKLQQAFLSSYRTNLSRILWS